MSKDAVLKVKEAEAEAQRIVQEATARSRAMIDNAEKTSEQECKKYEAEMSVEYKRRVEQVKTDAKALTDENREETMAKAVEIENAARGHMNEAVRIVMRRIISECQ